MQSLVEETNRLKKMINDEISHSYIEQYIQKPFIDYDKLSILHYLYEPLDLSETEKSTYITTIMLVQIALDTHDKVLVHTDEKNETEQQLTVLAGDYYSGLYYLLLSKLNDIKSIHLIAATIKQINEVKMDLYYYSFDTIRELFQAIKTEESMLYTKVAEMLGQPQEVIRVIEQVLFIKRLEREYSSLDVKSSYLRQCIEKRSDMTKAFVIAEIKALLKQVKKDLKETILLLPYEYREFKEYVLNAYPFTYKPSIAREG